MGIMKMNSLLKSVRPWMALYVASFLIASFVALAVFGSQSHPADEVAVVLAIPLIVIVGIPNLIRALLGIQTPLRKREEEPKEDKLVLANLTEKMLFFALVLSLLGLATGAILGVSALVYFALGLVWAREAVAPFALTAFLMGLGLFFLILLWAIVARSLRPFNKVIRVQLVSLLTKRGKPMPTPTVSQMP